MNRISSFYVVYVAITVLYFTQFCALGHENKNTSVYHRLSRSMDDESLKLQQSSQHHKKTSATESKNDNIVFEPENMYNVITKRTEQTLNSPLFPPLLANRSNPQKSNETNHQYSGKANGEYEFSLTIRNGIRRVESGEYEEHNGQTVFVVRGFFEHITNDGIVKVTAYVFDHFGYHEIPVTTDSDGIVDLYGPDQAHDCDYSKGVYCIDRKLLSLMVG